MGYLPAFESQVHRCDICKKTFISNTAYGGRMICLECEREVIEKSKPRKSDPVPSDIENQT
jgi:hypothetical protein